MRQKSRYKIVVALALVLTVSASLWFALPAALDYDTAYAQGGYGGAGAAGSPTPGYSGVGGSISPTGVLSEDVTIESSDQLLQLTVVESTTALTKWGTPITGIIIAEMEDPPAPPADAAAIGLTYYLGPDGATFDQPVAITFSYVELQIPAGVAEESLYIAMWDEEADEWVKLDSVVNIENNTITVEVNHFTIFTIIVSTRPAAFKISDFTITPSEVDIGEEVTISVGITNTGDFKGSYQVALKIDNVAIATRTITLTGQASRKITFTTIQDAAGSYTVNVNDLSGTFIVKAPPAPAPAPAPAPPPPPAPAPPITPAPPAPAVPPVTPVVNWWIIGAVIAVVIIIGLITWQVVARRRT